MSYDEEELPNGAAKSCWVYYNQMYVLNSMLCYVSMLILALCNYQLKYLLLMALLMNAI